MSERLVSLGKREGEVRPRPAPAPGAPRVYVETYGCQMNVADSDLLGGVLADAGYATASRADDADVIVINTCAVREKAEERVIARAGELASLKRKKPGTVLAIVGCMAEHLKEGLADRAPTVDVIAGPDSYRRMPELLAAARAHRRGDAPPLIDVKLDKAETYEGLSNAAGLEGGDPVSGFVTIQRGCDKFCTFCVVPFTRGRERGTSPREVLRQVRELVAAGLREVTLLGQTVNSYRWPAEDGEVVTFAELLRAVARVDGIERIRFTSPYPVDFTDDVIAAIAEEPKICKYVHLPVQSGSDVVLERMRRGYTVDDFRGIVARLRHAMPHIALSTDILSGFSGETEADHQATLALMREIRFDSAFMFAYSERDLTFAAKKLPDDVDEPTKKRRLTEIVQLQEIISAEVFAAHVGRPERVLVHGPSKRDATQLMGRTDGFKTVILPSGVGAVGELVDVTIARATMATLFA
ncbi:MAG: tRNA (N6-isopentenyl adenosine(37)-C2)-methylthiotransferase MiaB [Deltaproteobacteria bacterium]|nr:tRNA (N6-isopentenyl adenosine(37)-C2)-methylthiotransferase MiaB [Deltaproteobacteria bacterium]MDQ3298608.1 tRNA (N6-isopentenyl adenosine(37)-C2)-methylthiotransferase MiaB [Myxococcota bacterium]